MECKKCHKECLESELEDNICMDCMKGSKTNKTKTYIIIASVIVLALISLCFFVYLNISTPINNYQKQAVSILKQYQQGGITNIEAEERIKIIREKTNIEYEEEQSTELLILTSILERIEGEFSKGELSDTEVNTYIREIKTVK